MVIMSCISSERVSIVVTEPTTMDTTSRRPPPSRPLPGRAGPAYGAPLVTADPSRSSEPDDRSPAPAQQDTPGDLAPVVGANLRRLRVRRGLSLERLAQRSGVSRAMLSQIELGQSAPTINVLWKI